MNESIDIKFNEDYRNAFRKDQVISIPIRPLTVTYLVGPNGCGKSTILRAIRSINDTLESNRVSDFDGCRNTRITHVARDMKSGIFEVTGAEEFSHIFAFDAEADNNTDVLNAYSAGGFVCGGGYAATRMSRGQNVLVEFSKFTRRFEEYAEKHIKDQNWNPLIIIDEVDEGLDVRMQFNWNAVLERKFCFKGATVLIVSHNPVCMLSQGLLVKAFNIVTGELYDKPGDYIEKLTGYTITIDGTNQKPWSEQVNYKK